MKEKIFVVQPRFADSDAAELDNQIAAIRAALEKQGDELCMTILDEHETKHMSELKDGNRAALFLLGAQLETIAQCDKAVFLPDWERSKTGWMLHEACLRFDIQRVYAHWSVDPEQAEKPAPAKKPAAKKPAAKKPAVKKATTAKKKAAPAEK